MYGSGNMQPTGQPSDVIDLDQVVALVFKFKWSLIVSALVGLLLGILYLHVTTYRYTASITVAPINNNQGGMPGSLTKLSGLASVAGINLQGDMGGLAYSQYLQAMQSRIASELLAQHEDVLKVVFPKEWKTDSKTWHQPQGLGSSLVQTVKQVLGVPVRPWSRPDGGRLQQFMDKFLSVDEPSDKPFATVSFSHEDPTFAVRVLELLNRDIDNYLRSQALHRATENIDYLNQQLAVVTNAEHRQAIAQTLIEQEKIRMMAKATAPYAAEIFGRATVSVKPTSPSPVVVLLGSVVLGVGLGAAWAFVKHRRSHRKEKTSDSEPALTAA